MVLSKNPDDLLRSLGGCGRYQIRMALVIHMMKTVICWSLLGMIYFTATPPFRCADDDFNTTDTGNVSSAADSGQRTFDKKCFTRNGTKCTRFIFDEDYMQTAVADFELVCDSAWIPSTIMSIQLAGMLVGNFAAGQLADLFGRKRPFFFSLFLLIIFSVVCFFTTSWPLFAVARIFIGIGSAFFLTIQYSLMSEFSLAEWRAWIIGFPSWPIQACVLSLVLWLLKDWRYVNLITAFLGVPFIAAWWIIPESFRWYIAHDRAEEAHTVIRSVARFNKRLAPDIAEIQDLQVAPEKADRKYTILDLFKSRTLLQRTLLSLLNWFTLGFVSYGVSFGISALSGSIFLNIFLFNVVSMPSKAIAMWLQNSCYFDGVKGVVTNICFTTVPLLIIIVMNVVMYLLTWRKVKDETRNIRMLTKKSNRNQPKSHTNASHRAAKTMTFFVVAFLIQWWSLALFGVWAIADDEVPQVIFHFVTTFTNLGGCLNLGIYLLIRRKAALQSASDKECKRNIEMKSSGKSTDSGQGTGATETSKFNEP